MRSNGLDLAARRARLGRIGEPAAIGRAVRFLLCAEVRSFTAHEFVVEGGNISSQRM
jgi:NAD(P)-dependent dehydrogenase (short-subunit alcohol dehydrogenase family)